MTESTHSPQGWAVLDYADPTDLRKVTRKLADAGINHFTRLDGDAIVITVPQAQLNDASAIVHRQSLLENAGSRHRVPYYGTYIRLLLSLPSGAIIGNTLFAAWSAEPRFTASVCAVVFAVSLEFLVHAWSSSSGKTLVGVTTSTTTNQR